MINKKIKLDKQFKEWLLWSMIIFGILSSIILCIDLLLTKIVFFETKTYIEVLIGWIGCFISLIILPSKLLEGLKLFGIDLKVKDIIDDNNKLISILYFVFQDTSNYYNRDKILREKIQTDIFNSCDEINGYYQHYKKYVRYLGIDVNCLITEIQLSVNKNFNDLSLSYDWITVNSNGDTELTQSGYYVQDQIGKHFQKTIYAFQEMLSPDNNSSNNFLNYRNIRTKIKKDIKTLNKFLTRMNMDKIDIDNKLKKIEDQFNEDYNTSVFEISKIMINDFNR